MSPGLFVRADAGPTLGVGHFMRMLALAQEWRARGGHVAFGGTGPGALRERAGAPFIERDLGIDDDVWTITQARASGCAWIAADGYSFGLRYQRNITATGLRLLVVDDNGENRSYAANWILNVNAHAREAMYSSRGPNTRLLLGSRFLLLRSAILRARLPAAARSDALLVSFGGADPADATRLTLGALSSHPALLERQVVVLIGAANDRGTAYRTAHPESRFRILVDPEGVEDIMAAAGACICSPSTTFWEMSYLGVPCIGLVVADNQQPIAADVQAKGLMRILGDARLIWAPGKLGEAIAAALTSKEDLERMVEAAASISDGQGAKRVVDALLEPTT